MLTRITVTPPLRWVQCLVLQQGKRKRREAEWIVRGHPASECWRQNVNLLLLQSLSCVSCLLGLCLHSPGCFLLATQKAAPGWHRHFGKMANKVRDVDGFESGETPLVLVRVHVEPLIPIPVPRTITMCRAYFWEGISDSVFLSEKRTSQQVTSPNLRLDGRTGRHMKSSKSWTSRNSLWWW